MSRETTLVSLAMLKVETDRGGSYLSYLLPFVWHVIGRKKEKTFTPKSVAEALLEEFGIVIPPETVQVTLNPYIKKGRLSKKANNEYEVKGEIEPSDLSQQRADAKRKINAVTDALIKYAKERHNKDISEQNAFNALISFLSKFNIDCIKSYLRGTALPDIESDEDWMIRLVCHFVNQISNSKPETFEHFMVMVKGHMLANAFLCPELDNVSETRYKKVTFYLDTPILLDILGLSGDARESSAKELIGSLRNVKGKVSYFSHTLKEVQSVIESAANGIDDYRCTIPVAQEARRQSKTKSDLLLMAEKAEYDFKRFSIMHENTPKYEEEFQIDEKAFEGLMEDEKFFHNYERAKENDVNSVRSIYALRGNISPTSIEACKAVFITSNTAFARAAYKYGRNYERFRSISSVISNFILTNMIWLKLPVKVREKSDLPRREILAFAYAGIKPGPDFLNRVNDEFEKMEEQGDYSSEDLEAMRSHPFVIDEISCTTLGDEDKVDEKSLGEALRNSEIKIAERETSKVRNRVIEQCGNVAKTFVNIAGVTFISLLAVGFSLTISPLFGFSVNLLNLKGSLFVMAVLAIFILIIFTIMNMFGISIMQCRDYIKERFRDRLVKYVLGPDSSSSQDSADIRK